MKKGNLTKKQIWEAYNKIGTQDKLIGYIGNIPVYSNPNVPEGMIYMLDYKQFDLLK